MSNEQEIYLKIMHANKEYRNGTPVMSDSDYDTLVENLRRINPNHIWFRHPEPGMDIADRREKLPYPMRSLDKVKTFEQLMAWFNKVGVSDSDEIVITPKYDGISLLFNSENGMSYTRGGDENEGMNCYYHTLKMQNMEQRPNPVLPYTFGEVIISKDNWQKYFEGKISISGTPYKSARNTVAGLFRRDIPGDELSYVSFVRYGAFGYPENSFALYTDLLRYMRGFGETSFFNTSCVIDITERGLENLFDFWSEEFNIDGLVLYVNDMSRWNELGRDSSTGNPKWAIAYKPESFTSSEITKVLSVNCKVSKSGALKPTVKVDAVELEGATIDNPTGYNARFCINEGIGKGATIKIIRSGMVIPKIVNVISPVSRKEALEPFKVCPSCGCLTVWGKNEVDVYCSNNECSGKRLAQLVHFCEKLEYDNIGEETLRSLFKNKIDEPGKLLMVDMDDLRTIDGIGNETAEMIIGKNRELFDNGVSLFTLIEASCVFEGIGEKKAKLICMAIGEELLRKWLNGCISLEDKKTIEANLLGTSGIGSSIASMFLSNMDRFVSFTKKWGLPINCGFLRNTNDKLSRLKVCFTGIRDKELERSIEGCGGSIVNSVSKQLSCLIVKDINQSSSKKTKAESLSIPIMTIEQFKEKYAL